MNFDETFLTGSGNLAVADYIPIYSIVNSLAEAAGISRVQYSCSGANGTVGTAVLYVVTE